MMVLGFAGMILVGTILLFLPFSSNAGESTSLVDAFFTATSAVTVTGLVVVESGTHWSPFGIGVILFLIQVGGLGFMTSSTLLLLIIGRRITLRERLLIREALAVGGLGGLVRLIRQIVIIVFAIEALGVVLLFIRFSFDYPLASALWQAVFHSVSAFNNAGFSILQGSQSLIGHQGDASMLLLIALLVILGGISFTVMADVAKVRGFSRLTLDSKIVLSTTLFLWVAGMAVILLAEPSNPLTLGPLSLPAKLLNGFFHAVTPRTAGFNTLDIAGMQVHTLFFIMALMFIGGASGSTAGGIKVNTFGVLLIAILGSIRGRAHAEAFGREVPEDQIRRALTVVLLAIALVFILAFLLTVTEDLPFMNLLFETVSAFGTVGLTTGITATLSTWGQLIIIITMFVGRLGPLTLALSLAQQQERVSHRYRYAQERVKIG